MAIVKNLLILENKLIMWMSSYTSSADDPFQKPPFVNICYLAYTDNLPAWSYGYHQQGQVDETYPSVCLGLFILIKKIYQYRSMVLPIASSSYASDVLWYIDQHCGEDISLESLAKHFNIGASHLRRVFKQVYNISPIT